MLAVLELLIKNVIFLNALILKQPQTKKTKTNSVALVRERTIPTERQPLVDEVSANFCG
jgi:hypothetical protein